jgi:flagellar L-ring protein precursor FlgH
MMRKLPFKISGLLLILQFSHNALAGKTKPKTIQKETTAAYVDRMQQQAFDLSPKTPGSLWTDNGKFSSLAMDYKAAHVGDLITVVVVQATTADNAASVSAARTLSASSSITALAAHASTSAVKNLFSPTSASSLAGKSQAATTSSLTTSLAGRVVAVLPSGVLVIEAERQLTMNNEKQTLLVRGLVRPSDVASDNSIASNSIGNLELELKGKGVLSDGVRPPNPMVRAVLWLFGF